MPTILKPQEGPQTQFIRTRTDICIYGGAAGGGKSYGLLLTALRYKGVIGFNYTIFRRNFNQIFVLGGLWDQFLKVYGGIRGSDPRRSFGRWHFYDSAENEISKISFAHIERMEDVLRWLVFQLCGIGFNELTHFPENTFFYMLSRNRLSCAALHLLPVLPVTRMRIPGLRNLSSGGSILKPDIRIRIGAENYNGLSGSMRRCAGRTKKELWEAFDLTTPEKKRSRDPFPLLC